MSGYWHQPNGHYLEYYFEGSTNMRARVRPHYDRKQYVWQIWPEGYNNTNRFGVARAAAASGLCDDEVTAKAVAEAALALNLRS
jgi:hypothetical protein